MNNPGHRVFLPIRGPAAVCKPAYRMNRRLTDRATIVHLTAGPPVSFIPAAGRLSISISIEVGIHVVQETEQTA